MVCGGEFGKVQMITVNFGSFKEYNMENRFFNLNLAGGAMLDIGVYALSFVRWFMSKTQKQHHLLLEVAKMKRQIHANSLLPKALGK